MATMTTAQMADFRCTLIEQQLRDVESKIEHYAARISRGTADIEDRLAFTTYSEVWSALKALIR